MTDLNPIETIWAKGLRAMLLVMIGIPLIQLASWILKQRERYRRWRCPNCPVCDETMASVANVGYVCDREGCAAYGDEYRRARRRARE